MIYIEAQSGLCNRMRALDSALALASHVGVEVALIWPRDEALNCSFDELFLRPDRLARVIEVDRGLGQLGRLERGAMRLVRTVRLRLAGVRAVYIRELPPRGRISDDLVSLAKERGLYIRTPHSFFPSEVPFAELQPARPILEGVARLGSGIERAIGVHIRRTDHRRAIEHSPLDGFIRAMRQELASDPQVRFFVATDSPKELESLNAVFGDTVFTHAKRSLARSDPQAIVDAAIDLFALASCRKLIGSYWSSFSEVAWRIRGIERVIVGGQ